MLSAAEAPGWGFAPEPLPTPPSARRWSTRMDIRPKTRNPSRWTAVLRLSEVRGQIRTREVAGSLGLRPGQAAELMRTLVRAGLLRTAGYERVPLQHAHGSRQVRCYGLTRLGRRWLLVFAGAAPATCRRRGG